MKQIVETTGDFELYVPAPEQHCLSDRPSVVVTSNFISQHAAAGRLRLIAQVNDDATDLEFAKYVKESKGDIELAVASFVSAFPVLAEGEVAPAPKPPKAPRAAK